ncbi:MAG: type II toxin-antitoxin system Phd/YefM family antitoxin [Gracilimonas sp.]|uniref:type II toxin-antitoxin system Phd/YefM family antitoxin n=1 Tax=Gracilimonas TaxID=649462 RepID=UPI001B07A370|nr:type II toxin-antitoxin system Phd/YefM family antitoxin [Gracilimonas sp.]MBO6586698.1 type II toxin-antitoxin system Phd/YefM family antitoxin [Gracilimonas sp.]MBO6615355.1 type II toxin-antitoxin system Phd/YefM family antitoxin [Gracilimonas sp.]
MKKVPVNEVREQLAKYLTEAERGEEVIITRHNKPVAKLVNYEEPKKEKFSNMEEFRNSLKVEGSVLNTLIEMRNEERVG